MKKHILTDNQIETLRTCFALRINQMKKGKLSHDEYVESGKFYEDLEDVFIHGIIDVYTFDFIDQLFKDELIKASLNPKMYEGIR